MASSSTSTGASSKRTMLKSTFALTLMAGMAIMPTRAQYPSLNTACTRHYTVQQGDTCDIIGQKTLTSTYQIMANNLPQSGPDCYTLQPGAQLCLGKYGNDCQMVHRATGNDNCESIAGQYGISVDLLLQNNPTANCDQIYDGLVLCTLNGLVRPPANPALHLHEKAPKPGDAQMPLGSAIVAVNPPAPASSPASSSEPAANASQSSTSPAKEQKIASPPKHHHFKHGAGSRHSHH